MPLVWDQPVDRVYESGISKVAVYANPISGGNGQPWNGVINIDTENVGGEVEEYFYYGVKTGDAVMQSTWQASIKAFGPPTTFASMMGFRTLRPGLYAAHQARATFNMTYRTEIGNAVDAKLGYKLHFVWNVTATTENIPYNTISDTPSPVIRSWKLYATPPAITGLRPTAYFYIDSRYENPTKLAYLENMLYNIGTMPTQTQVITA